MAESIVTNALGKTFGKRQALAGRLAAGAERPGSRADRIEWRREVDAAQGAGESAAALVRARRGPRPGLTSPRRVDLRACRLHGGRPAPARRARCAGPARLLSARSIDTGTMRSLVRLLQTLDLAPTTALARASRGERMKAALVATLAFHPEVLILDEPLEGLDPLTREQVVDGLLELVSAEGTTLLIASHDLDVLERLLDQVAMLHDGRVVFTGTARRPAVPVSPAGSARRLARRRRAIARRLHGRPRHRHRYAMPADPVRRGRTRLRRCRRRSPVRRSTSVGPPSREAFVAHARAMRGAKRARGAA